MTKKILRNLKPVFMCFIIMSVLCGVIYPGSCYRQLPRRYFQIRQTAVLFRVTLKDGTQKGLRFCAYCSGIYKA